MQKLCCGRAGEYMHFLPNQIEIHQDPVATIRRGELVLEKSGEEEFRGGVKFWDSARGKPDAGGHYDIS